MTSVFFYRFERRLVGGLGTPVPAVCRGPRSHTNPPPTGQTSVYISGYESVISPADSQTLCAPPADASLPLGCAAAVKVAVSISR